jgi:membrane protease YdiL (CAAX protease family)
MQATYPIKTSMRSYYYRIKSRLTRNIPDAINSPFSLSSPTQAVVPWSVYTVIASLFSGYILFPLLAAKLILIVHPSVSSVEQMLWQQGVTFLSWLGIFLFLGSRYGSDRVRQELGLVLPSKKWMVLWQSVQLLLLTVTLTLLMNQFWQMLEQVTPSWNAGLNPYSHLQRPELLALSFFAVFTAPILEELVFRGLVQSALNRLLCPALSILLTCGIFLLFHSSYFGNLKAVSHVLILALCLGWWRERTRSVLPGMAVHLLNNVLASSMLLLS